MGFYIGHVEISASMAEKIQAKHNVTPDEVREVCHGRPGKRWDADPVHGERLLVLGTTSTGRRLRIILQPVDVTDGTWRLRTAIAES